MLHWRHLVEVDDGEAVRLSSLHIRHTEEEPLGVFVGVEVKAKVELIVPSATVTEEGREGGGRREGEGEEGRGEKGGRDREGRGKGGRQGSRKSREDRTQMQLILMLAALLTSEFMMVSTWKSTSSLIHLAWLLSTG